MLAVYIVFIQIFDLIAIYFGKMFSLTDKIFYIVLCSLAWALSGVFFSLSLKYEGLAIVIILWISLSTVAATLLGVIYFKEHISAIQYCAMGVIIVGVVLLILKPSVA